MDDYISREAALKEVGVNTWAGARLKEIPAADVRPAVRGKWIQKPFLLGTTNVCSRCESYYGMPHEVFNFCPNCGADMREANPSC